MLRHHALRIEDTAHQHMAARRVPGVAIALVDGGDVVWSTDLGLASSHERRHLCRRTVFEAASLSMPLFAYAVFQLVEQGVLDLDAPLASLDGGHETPEDPRAAHITARMCLSHTSGLPGHPSADRLDVWGAPGAGFAYSPGGYLYLQRAVEHLTGQPLAAWMRRTVLGPLGLRDTGYAPDDQGDGRLAHGHDRRGCPAPRIRRGSPLSLHTTATDFARFLCAVLDPASSLVSRCALDEMLRGHVVVGQTPDGGPPAPGTMLWGLGWGLSPTPFGMSSWHWGRHGGFTCFCIGWRKQRAGLVVMTNGMSGLSVCREVVTALTDEVHPAFAWLEREPPDQRLM